MPQLDFFTFPHQYIIASICFCGMYYFNLFFVFPQIKHLQLNKIFSINALAANFYVIEGDYLDIFKTLLLEENYIFENFLLKSKKFQKKYFVKKLTAATMLTKLDSQNLVLVLLLSFLFFFIFFKNFLIFNAEKLMLIYFLLISCVIFFFFKTFIKSLLEEDLKWILFIATSIEIEGEKSLEILKITFLKLKNNLNSTYIEFLLLKILELKLIKKIND